MRVGIRVLEWVDIPVLEEDRKYSYAPELVISIGVNGSPVFRGVADEDVLR